MKPLHSIALMATMLSGAEMYRVPNKQYIKPNLSGELIDRPKRRQRNKFIKRKSNKKLKS